MGESADSLAEAGGQLMLFPSEISGMTISKLKEELAAMKVDWIYHSKVNKPKLVALLHRLKKDDWQPSTREKKVDNRPKPRFWEKGDEYNYMGLGGFGGYRRGCLEASVLMAAVLIQTETPF